MSLADACIVCMSEIHDRHAVLTLDSDFLVYRKHGRASLMLIPGDAINICHTSTGLTADENKATTPIVPIAETLERGP